MPWMACGAILYSFLATVTPQADAQEAAIAVAADTHVSIAYTLRLDEKTVLETNVGSTPLTYVHGAQQIISGLENALEGMKIGESKQVTVPPEKGYGGVDQAAIIEVEPDKIPPDARKVGAVIQGRSATGQVVRGRVTEMKDATVVLDFNHPLAGKTLYFEIKVLDIQQAPGK